MITMQLKQMRILLTSIADFHAPLTDYCSRFVCSAIHVAFLIFSIKFAPVPSARSKNFFNSITAHMQKCIVVQTRRNRHKIA